MTNDVGKRVWHASLGWQRKAPYPENNWVVLCGAQSCRNRLGKVLSQTRIELEPGFYEEGNGTYYRSRKYKHAFPTRVRTRQVKRRWRRSQPKPRDPGDEPPKRRAEGYGPTINMFDGTPKVIDQVLINCPRCGETSVVSFPLS